MSAFVAEAAARPAHADELLRRAAKHITVLVVPGALVAAAAAPLALALFGSDFVESGTPVLRLLLLAAIPQIALSLAIGQARYRRRVSDVVMLAMAASLAPVIGAAFFAPTYGIVAVGWAVLIGQHDPRRRAALHVVAQSAAPTAGHRTQLGSVNQVEAAPAATDPGRRNRVRRTRHQPR